MYRSTLLAAVAAIALSAPALAADPAAKPQSGQSSSMSAPLPGASGGAAASQQYADSTRLSDVVGMSVRGQNDENIGEINDLLIGQDGQVQAAVVDVGGFLGIGEHRVAIDWKQLQFGQEQDNQQGGQQGGQQAGNQQGGQQGGQQTAQVADAEQADFVLLNTTKEQLSALPEYQDPDEQDTQNSGTQNSGTGGTTGTSDTGQPAR